MSGKKSATPLIVRKRFGIGWTLNPKHPLTWVVYAAILVIAVYLIFTH